MNLAGLIGGQHLSGGGNRVQLIACTSNIDAVHMARRRAVLAQFLAEAEPGIRLCEHIEDVDGAIVFRQACVMGLEGVVAKRRDSRYRSGRCREEGGREGY